MVAADSGTKKICQLLLANGAKVNSKDQVCSLQSCLHISAQLVETTAQVDCALKLASFRLPFYVFGLRLKYRKEKFIKHD